MNCRLLALMAMTLALGACHSAQHAMSDPLESGNQAYQGAVARLKSKDQAVYAAKAIIRWRYESAQPAAANDSQKPTYGALHTLFATTLSTELPKLIAEQESNALSASSRSILEPIERKLSQSLNARCQTALSGVAIESVELNLIDPAQRYSTLDEVEIRQLHKLTNGSYEEWHDWFGYRVR